MRKRILLAFALLSASGGLAAANASTTGAAEPPPAGTTAPTATSAATTTQAGTADEAATAAQRAAHRAALRWLGGQIGAYRRATWRWQRLMGQPLSETGTRDLAAMSVPDAKGALARWERRARTARRAAQHPPHLRGWLCIHRYEGGWHDGGGPYYGGLQMDWGFMSRYGGRLLRTKGTADRWTPLEQIWVAEKARRSGRGFWPWPSTARYCGLL